MNQSTGQAPNKVVIGFKAREPLSILNALTGKGDRLLDREAFRQHARDAADFAIIQAKKQYDKKYKALLIKPGDKAFLTLHKGYIVPKNKGRKFLA